MNKYLLPSFLGVASLTNLAYAQFPVYNSIPAGSFTYSYTPGVDPSVTTFATTYVTMDDILPTSGGIDANAIQYTLYNPTATAQRFRVNFVFWKADGTTVGPTGVNDPGTYFANPGNIGFGGVVTQNPGASVRQFTLPAGFLPLAPTGEKLWLGIYLNTNVGTGTASSSSDLGLMRYIITAPSVGTSTDTIFETNNADVNGYFGINNPVGGQFNFGTATTANLAYKLLVPGATLSGNVSLGDTVSAMAQFRNVTIKLVQGTNTINSLFVTVNPNTSATSAYSVGAPSGLTGPATLEFDGGPYLKRKVAVNLTGGNITGLDTVLKNGDVDASGEVDAVDIDQVIADFGTLYPGGTTPNADVDDSGEVDAVDIDIVITNFGGLDD